MFRRCITCQYLITVSTMAKIGIFWVYNHTVLGKAIDTLKGQDAGIGLIDSPDQHSDIWENNKNFQSTFPALIGMDYQDIPRGRIIFHKNKDYYIIYLDQTLINKPTKQLIRDFFNLQDQRCLWQTDFHYTTQQDALDLLFADN